MNLLSVLLVFLMTITVVISRGRKPKIDFENQKKIFLQHAEQLQNPNIKYNDPVFTEMSKKLEHAMTPMALYLSLNRHRSVIFALNDEIINDAENSNEESKSLGSTSPASQNSQTMSGRENYDFMISNQKCQTFSFYLDIYDWNKITPLSVCRRRSGTTSVFKYNTLPKFKWSNLIKEKLWIHSKLPCTWTLKKHKIRNDSINLVGKCSQCDAEIRIYNSRKTEKIMNFNCIVDKFDKTFKHNAVQKSKLTPFRRRQIAKRLCHKSAVKVRNELASTLITGAERLAPPVLPSLSCLRKIKSEARHEHLPHSNPILSLFIMAKISARDNINIIREFNIFPDFRLYFWSNDQIQYYNNYQTKFKKATITVDATGSFFQNMYLPDGTSATKRLFLYVGLLTADDKLTSVPIFQMVTDSHSERSILLWLRKWLSYIDTPPTEVITDDSSALVSACVQAFALCCTTKSYIKHLFTVLEGSNSEKPKAFIRLDTSHFIKVLHNLSCFKTNLNPKVKYFYIRCMVCLKKCENYQLAKNIIHDVIKLCLGQYNNEIKSRLEQLLRDVTVDDVFVSEDNDVNKSYDFDDGAINNEDFEFINWFNSIVEDTKKQNPVLQDNKNAYYYPPFIPTFRRILMKLPLWSNLSRNFFESENIAPSSSGCESYFKTLKHLVFKTKFNRHRVDEFFKLYTDYLEGEMKSALCNLGQGITNKMKSKNKPRKRISKTKLSKIKKQRSHQAAPRRSITEDSILSDLPSYVENWRGEAKIIKSKPNINAKFTKNGNLRPSVYINSNNVKVLNTCAFDSVMYLMSAEYIGNENFRNIVDAFDEKKLIPQYIKYLSRTNCNDDDIYNLRAKIITQFIEKPTEIESKIYNYNVACNVTYIYEHFLLEYFTSSVFTKICTNQSCSSNILKKNVFLPLNIDILNIFDISMLEEAISIVEGGSKCASCEGIATSNYVISNLISFDLNGTNAVALNKVPRTLYINNKMYKIIGAVEFVAPLHSTGIGHYKAHHLVDDTFFCYDDNCTKITESTNQDILLHLLSYVLIDT